MKHKGKRRIIAINAETGLGVNSLQMGGKIANRLLEADFDVGALRPFVDDEGQGWITLHAGTPYEQNLMAINATLRHEEWLHLDQVILDVALNRLVIVADLYAAGLTYPTGGLGETVMAYEDMSDIEAASINMDGITRNRDDVPEMDMNYLPLPIIHKDFSLNLRYLEASRRRGTPMDTTMARKSGRKIGEAMEDLTLVGTGGITYGGGTIQGLLNFTHRNTYSLTASWDDSSTSGTVIVNDVNAMIAAAEADHFYGPYNLYIPTSYAQAMRNDYKAASDKTVEQRILELNGINAVRVADRLTADNVVLVQMTDDVIRIAEGLPITTLQWEEEGGMRQLFKIMTISVPQLRADQDNRCGIVHGS